MGGGRCNSGSSSSGEEDGDAEWRAAIDSVANGASFSKRNSDGLPSSSNGRATSDDKEKEKREPKIKLYQIKAQKLLDELLEKTIEVVSVTPPIQENNAAEDDVGVRLFRKAPRGIVFDHIDELQGPKRKPKIIRGEEVDEKSKKFRKKLQSVAVDGADIISAARAACQKSLAKIEAREAAAKAAAKSDEERVAELKKIRGERWLPSIARDMRADSLYQKRHS